MADHETDLRWIGVLGRENEIGLVLAIFIVTDDQELALSERVEGVADSVQA